VSDGGHGEGGGGGGGHKRRGHDEEHEEHENHERWLVSYADMMTLLMVLFIVMFAISQVDQKKFMALKTGLSAGFGAPVAMLSGADALLDVGGAVAPDSINLAGSGGNGKGKDGQAQQTTKADQQKTEKQVVDLVNATSKAAVAQEVKNLKAAQQKLQQALVKAGTPKGAGFRFDERGLVVTIATDKVLFDNGGATLLPGGRHILDALTPTLAALPNKLSIDGHTNNAPIHTAQFPSNWELSADRATGVLRYLEAHIPASRMSASAFGDTHPLKPATDPTALVANRRVEIVVLANVDNAAGRSIDALGNQPEPTPTPSLSPVHTSAEAQDPWAKPSTEASPSPSAADPHAWLTGTTSGTSQSGSGSGSGAEVSPSGQATGSPSAPADWTQG
jgi:chemotaxis protein MotB